MTLTHPPATFARHDAIAVDSALAVHRRRRPRWWPVALATIVVVPLMAVAVGQIAAPALSFDGGPVVWRTVPGDLTGVKRVDNVLGTEVTVGFERSGPFTATLALVNHGRYPVKVLGLPDRGAFFYGLESVGMASDPEAPSQPFHSFTLRRGATRWLMLQFRFASCELEPADGVAASRTSLPIDYRVFGLHRREAVPFQRFALSVPSGRCDHPVLSEDQ
jgi:hypothetical protein